MGLRIEDRPSKGTLRVTRILDRFQSALFSPQARTAVLAHALLIGAGALVAALLVAAGGPLYGSAAFLVLVFGVLMLRDIDGLNTEEAATALNITSNAVKLRLHRARMALRALLAPHFQGAAA